MTKNSSFSQLKIIISYRNEFWFFFLFKINFEFLLHAIFLKYSLLNYTSKKYISIFKRYIFPLYVRITIIANGATDGTRTRTSRAEVCYATPTTSQSLNLWVSNFQNYCSGLVYFGF